jgi:hypothetical protein
MKRGLVVGRLVKIEALQRQVLAIETRVTCTPYRHNDLSLI